MVPQDLLPLDEMIEQIAEIGFPAIEIWGRGDNFETIYNLTIKNNLRLVSMIGHQSLPDGLNNPGNHDRIEAELKESIDIAADKGVNGLICFSGNRIPGMDDAEAIANTVTGLRRSVPYAETKGINLNIELLNSKVDHAGYQCDHTSWGLEVVEQVNSPRVKLLYDIYHMQIMEGDIIRTMVDNLTAIGHIHTAGNPGRNDLDDDQELNYQGICRALSAAGYQGHVGHEFRPKGDLIPALSHAFAQCTVE
jgi:hydroxypyruvate isomerase